MPEINRDTVLPLLQAKEDAARETLYKSNPLFARLQSKDHIVPFNGGREIQQPLEAYGAHPAAVSMHRGSLDSKECVSCACYSIEKARAFLAVLEDEWIKNAHDEQRASLINSRAKNAVRTMRNGMEEFLVRQLDLALPAGPGPLAMYGGISKTRYSMWAHGLSKIPTVSAENLLELITEGISQSTRFDSKPDLILLSTDLYSMLENALAANDTYERYLSADIADAGFEGFHVNGADIVWCQPLPEGNAMFLDTDFIYLRPHVDHDFIWTEEAQATDQDGKGQTCDLWSLHWQGNLTFSNMSTQRRMWVPND